MAERKANCCTSCCRSLILSGFSFLFTFIVYRVTTKGPRLYVSNISATGPAGPNLPPAIACTIEIKNRAKYLGIYYDDLQVSVTFPPSGPNASATIPAFYQGFHKRAFKDVAVPGAPWAAAKAAAGNSTATAALLTVEVDTRFRYKAAIIWKSKRYGLNVRKDVQVNADGKMTAPEHILLESAGPPRTRPPACLAAGTTAVLALLSLM